MTRRRARIEVARLILPGTARSSVIQALRQRTTAILSPLDGMEWPVSFSIDAYGMTVGIRASHEWARAAVERLLPPGARTTAATSPDEQYSLVFAAAPERMHVLYEGLRRIAQSADVDEITRALESHLHFAVAVGARTRLFVHAGVVGWRGGAIVVPGRTRSGKSSLVAALVRAGASYYSDEYAVLDDAGRVHPFARALGIRDADGRTRSVDPSSMGTIGHEPLPVRTVVVTRHVADTQWEPEVITPGETVLALLDNTVAVRARPADTLRILTAAVRGASAVRSARGDATDVVEYLLRP